MTEIVRMIETIVCISYCLLSEYSQHYLWESLISTCKHPGVSYGHLDSPCGHLNTSPTGTLKMDSVGLLIGRSNTHIQEVEEGYVGIREGQVLA